MTAPLDTSIPRKRFPQWTPEEQDFWIDMFDSFSQQFIGARLEKWSEAGGMTNCDAQLHLMQDDLRWASELADVAVQEMQYRFAIQQAPTRKAKRKRPATKSRKAR